ncbi:mitochondrial import inner membrane translocase subunit tim21 [Pestalotiopsis sp. IQ-011]
MQPQQDVIKTIKTIKLPHHVGTDSEVSLKFQWRLFGMSLMLGPEPAPRVMMPAKEKTQVSLAQHSVSNSQHTGKIFEGKLENPSS